MPKKERNDMVTKQECALEVYKWVQYLRFLSLIGILGTLLSLAFAYVSIDLAIIISICLIIIFVLYFKRALEMSQYLEKYYDVRRIDFIGIRRK